MFQPGDLIRFKSGGRGEPHQRRKAFLGLIVGPPRPVAIGRADLVASYPVKWLTWSNGLVKGYYGSQVFWIVEATLEKVS